MATHFIFVLDRSHSMAKQWQTVESAYNKAIGTRKNCKLDDFLSVLTFDNRVNIITAEPFLLSSGNFPTLGKCGGGSTSYYKALAEAGSFTENLNMPTKLIFLSDGEPNSDPSENIDAFIHHINTLNESVDGKLEIHLISFCHDNKRVRDEPTLKRMHDILTTTDRNCTFVEIARSDTVEDELCATFNRIVQ